MQVRSSKVSVLQFCVIVHGLAFPFFLFVLALEADFWKMGALPDFHYACLLPRPPSAFAHNKNLRGVWCDAFEVTKLGRVQAVCYVTCC